MARFRLLRSVLAFCWLTASLRAALHRPTLHPDTSLTILAICEYDGYLWLGAGDGLYRYDGSRYRKVAEYPFTSAQFLNSTGDGALWIGGSAGLIQYAGGHFRIVNRTPVLGMTTAHHQLFISEGEAGNRRLARVDSAGGIEKLKPFPWGELTTDTSDRVWFVNRGSTRACSLDGQYGDQLHCLDLADHYLQAAADRAGHVWVASDSETLPVGAGPERELKRKAQSFDRRGPLVTGGAGRLWFLGEQISELVSGLTLTDRGQVAVFPPTAGYEDSRGELWVAAKGRGLVEWELNPSWERWSREDLGGQPAAQVLRSGSNLIAVTHGSLFRLDPTRRQWVELPDAARSYDAALPYAINELITSSRELGVARVDLTGRVIERPPGPMANTRDFRQIVRDGSGRIWVANKSSLLRLHETAGALRMTIEPLPMAGQGQAQAVDIEIDDQGRPWVGYSGGIAWLDDVGHWHRISAEPALPGIRSFALAGQSLWAASRTTDAFFHLTRQENFWSAKSFTSEQGFGPGDTLFLRRDSRGWIWRGTADGVFVADGSHIRPEDWLHLDLDNGLASGEADNYGFFEDQDRSIWIAGDQGITHLHPSADWFDAPPGMPFVQTLEKPSSNVLKVRAGSLQLPPFRDFPLRARLAGDEWKFSRDGTFEFAGMRTGSYTLQLAYTGNRPAVASIPVTIGSPSRQTAWLTPIVSILALLIAVAVSLLNRSEKLRYRLRKLQFVLRSRLTGASFRAARTDLVRPSDLSGQVFLDKFVAERPVAHGEGSTIYSAIDRETGVRVAIKQLHGPIGSLRERFVREVATLRSVPHPNIVPVIESWIDAAGEACLAMPFLEGSTLRQELLKGPLNLTCVIQIAQGIGSALTALHARGIVHRDLKPENIILTRISETKWSPVLIDFGIATLRDRRGQLSTTRHIAGSLQYMAPEGLTGHYSTATDVYSFGVVILELLTLKKLGDFAVVFSDPRFIEELQGVLAKAVGEHRAARLAVALAQAYDPVPRNRPEIHDCSGAVINLLTRGVDAM